MNVRPLHDYVVIRRNEEAHVSRGGIVIPDTAAEIPMQGKVIAVGNGRILPNGNVVALTVNVDDKVLFGKYSDTEIKLDDEQLLVIHESDILAILEE